MKALFDYLKPITQKIDAKPKVSCTSKFGKGSSKKSLFVSTLLLSAGTILSTVSQQAVAQTNPSYPNFDQRYNAEIPGSLEAIGNASVICDRNNPTCVNGLANGTVGNNNGGLSMQMLDIDGDSSTFNSSSAQLNIPAGANVRFAALYWGATISGTTPPPNVNNVNQVSLKTPTSSSYQTITADDSNDFISFGFWRTYGAFADITSIVQNAGNGNYTVANVQSSTGADFTYPNAGWSIVVVYEDPNQPIRNISVFDGHTVVRNNAQTFNLTGIRTPPTAGFDVFMGAIANDGEVDQSGDFLRINGTNIFDTLNPANNFFNGTISKFGSHVTNRTPNDPYNMVFDIDYLDLTSWNQANNAIPTNATSIDLTLDSAGDGIWPLAYFFAVEVFEPNLVTRFEKTTPQTSYANGDVIPYTISVTNTGNDNATNTVITDALPAGTTYVSGSLKIDGVTKTDGAGDDEAEFDGSNVVFRVGAGANATQGGQININDTVTMTFDVTVTAVPGDLVCNQAAIGYQGQTSGNAASGTSDDPNTPTFGDCTEVTTTASAAKDYGDAPDTYSTNATDNSGEGIGAHHGIVSNLYLGLSPDAETDAVTPLDGSGDGSDEDGVTVFAMTEGATDFIVSKSDISVTNNTGRSATLHGWIDFDKDGVFSSTEHARITIPNGSVGITPSADLIWNGITVGASGSTYARFRLTTDENITAATPGGTANDGEVEDYVVAIAPPPPTQSGGFCTIPYSMVYSGHFPNRIDAIHVDSGAFVALTSATSASITNTLASDHINKLVYYAENNSLYAWSPITNTHTIITSDFSSFISGSVDLSSGGAAFYNGSLYVGIDDNPNTFGSESEVYRIDFTPGSNGLSIQSITSLNLNGVATATDWGDMIIDNNGIMLATGAGAFWTYNLNNGAYTQLTSSVPGAQHQLAKDGQGRLWAVIYIPSKFVVQVEVVGNTIQPIGSTISVDPHDTNDAAECVIGESSIGDRIWEDTDGDGVQDPGENGIENVTVDLYWDIDGDGQIDPGDDPVLATQTTGASGNYDFFDLIFGDYIVKVTDTNGVLSDAVLTTSSDEFAVNLPTGIVDYNDADFGYQLPIVQKDPNVLLVKRITQINGDTNSAGGDVLSSYINQDDTINPYDDNDITVADPVDPIDPPKDTDQWPDPNTSLLGGIDGGNVMPNDEIEYTIYFLSSGDATAESVLFCDYVPTFTSFIPNAYAGSAPQASGGIGGADLSIELFRNGTTDYHTGANDGDSATYFAPGTDPATSFPGIDCDGDSDGVNANTNGAVVVNLGDLPDATTDAAGAYGYVRFRARVK